MPINKKTKLLLAVLTLAVFPVASFAAFNDVTLTTDAVISVGGANLSISGSSATVESITAGENSFDVVLQSGSSISITSSDRKTFTVSPNSGDFTSSGTCDSSSSSLTITATGSITLTVTPSTVCSSTSSGGGSGGGGGIIQNALPNQPVPRKQIIYPDGRIVYLDEDGVAPIAKPTSPKEPVFSIARTLKFGMKHQEVKTLQEILSKDSAIYPEKLVTGYFGPLTQAAVRRFQAKYEIVSAGTPQTTGYGLVGPKTRAKLKEIFAQ